MKGSVKKAIIIIGVLIVLVICVLLNLRPVENFQQKYEGVDLSADVEGAVREGTYTKYLNAHEDAACPAHNKYWFLNFLPPDSLPDILRM